MSAGDAAARTPRLKGAKATALNTRLLSVVKTGSIEDVERLIEEGADVRHLSAGRGQNLVFAAAARVAPFEEGSGSQLELLKFLVERHGLDATMVDQLRQTPLFYAAKVDLEACKYLIETRCDPGHIDTYEQQAFFYAARENQDGIVKLLLENGSNAGQVDLGLQTALYYTSCAKCIDVLIQGGADPNLLDASGMTVCNQATRHGDLERIQHLLQHRADLNVKDHFKRTCLDIAQRHQPELVLVGEQLGGVSGRLQATSSRDPGVVASARSSEMERSTSGLPGTQQTEGADAAGGIINEAEFTAANIDMMVRAGPFEDLRKVLQAHQQNVKYVKRSRDAGQNYMHLAAARREQAQEMCEMLIESGVDLDKEDDITQTPLFYAVRPDKPGAHAGGVDCARMLLARRANPNTVDRNGETPLHYAAQRLGSDCIEALLEARADATHRSKSGYTPVHVAACTNATQSLRLLLDARCGPDVLDTQDSPLFICLHMESVDLLLAARCSPNLRRACSGRTPLMYANARHRSDIARALIVAGADLTARDDEGSTGLTVAAMTGGLEICRMLIKEFGCSPTIPNWEGTTAADFLQNTDLLEPPTKAEEPPPAEEEPEPPNLEGEEPPNLEGEATESILVDVMDVDASDCQVATEAPPSVNSLPSSRRDRSRSRDPQFSGGTARDSSSFSMSPLPMGKDIDDCVQAVPVTSPAPTPSAPTVATAGLSVPGQVLRKKYRMIFEDYKGNEIPYGTERYTKALRSFLRLHPWHDGWGLLQDSRPVFNVDSGDEGDL